MKIVIIGAGLSGLSCAIALRKYMADCDQKSLVVKVYDRPYETNSSAGDKEEQRHRRLGAGLGLQSNGLRVLNDLDPELRNKVYATGFPCTHFKWKTAGDYLLGREAVDVLPISRPLLIDRLAEVLPKDIFEYRLVSNVIAENGKKPIIQFEDGSPDETADLVVGADGVGSVVRHGLFGNDERYRPNYTGVCGVGGVLDLPLPQHLLDDPGMSFFIGPTGSCGYSGLTQSDKNKLLYWSIYETTLPERGTQWDHAELVKAMQARHRGWADPMIGKFLDHAAPDNVYPVFVMPELPHWGRDGCVLVGDAAHALPPRTGQGASQAFEDGQSLALLLAAYIKMTEPSEAVSKTIASFYDMRHKRVYKMRAWAVKWKDPSMPMPTWKVWMLYFFLFAFVKMRSVMTLFERVDDWDAKRAVQEYLRKSR